MRSLQKVFQNSPKILINLHDKGVNVNHRSSFGGFVCQSETLSHLKLGSDVRVPDNRFEERFLALKRFTIHMNGHLEFWKDVEREKTNEPQTNPLDFRYDPGLV